MSNIINNEEISTLKEILSILTSDSHLQHAFFFSKAGHFITITMNGQVTSEEFEKGCAHIRDDLLTESGLNVFNQYLKMIKSHPIKSYEIIKESLTNENTASQVRDYLSSMSVAHDQRTNSYNSIEAEACLEAKKPGYKLSCTYFPVIGEKCAFGMADNLVQGRIVQFGEFASQMHLKVIAT